ncbi:MAG TPA: flagellar protein FlaG, partial [Negativicutes bacterium]|nr:flagellar protein FlaG [Negativicutes bacterium]
HKVIKEFPPEKILDMAAKMWEIAGIIVDERR